MKALPTILTLILCLFLTACSKGNQINGRSLRTANRSVSYIKDRLPVEKRIEFEVSFWSLRDAIRDKKEFLDTVDGKTPEELIEEGKKLFQERKNAGFKGYDKFDSWEQMIADYTKQRMEQNRRKRPDPRDRQNNVLYNLGNM
ncbi:hypothetical protein [methane-oxidizing endosymbiont of Gigantopelta aegis]|uniref:hypothetical protein n=1 Tax=methane-oxidizing endosymbiont of Gigantopelta aegis TaxID=2794938 RepID=UPI0018DD89E9|nr:hypothetical protein [methane-oxidizing endosymbiont of Gigantopelta aegis]